MKKTTEKRIYMFPIALWFVIIPLIVKAKFFQNPLADLPWYSSDSTLADFFLYYKSVLVTITGVLMLVILYWQISRMRRKDTLVGADSRIFIPILVYLFFVILSSLFSEYGYFCTHGMPDQFETVWNLIAYVVTLFYCYYAVVWLKAEKDVLSLIFIAAVPVSLICVLQFLKIDIYRIIYAGEGYTFTFLPGQVYGPFYNINYVGYYTLLFFPLFMLLCIFCRDLKIRLASAVLAVALFISMIGAQSISAELAMASVVVFTVLFFLLKNVKAKKLLWIPIVAILAGGVVGCAVIAPKINAYIQASDTEKTDLENIFTNDDNVEIDYKGQKLYIQMFQTGDMVSFALIDQEQNDVALEYAFSESSYYYVITDNRFDGMTLMPVIITEDPVTYGFFAQINGKNWCFSNQLTEDGSYVYYNDLGKCTKLTSETVSPDFTPLVHMTWLANGRGYIWNKTIALLKNYIFLGSGADTFALVYPNGDFVDKYNNGYDNLILTKPHSLYLQIAVHSGVLSLIAFLVFYLWYFISGLRLYFRKQFDDPLTVSGFAILLGTAGYMISALANDSTITISPLYWALLGIGIGINQRIRSGQS
ncbi:MAG: O-antigen ligase family protein [Eubacterium sp.]|nr:O-antigen ligase family protein [Eubacterium sp.]